MSSVHKGRKNATIPRSPSLVLNRLNSPRYVDTGYRKPSCSKCRPWTNSICFTWDLVDNAESQAPRLTSVCILTVFPSPMTFKFVQLYHKRQRFRHQKSNALSIAPQSHLETSFSSVCLHEMLSGKIDVQPQVHIGNLLIATFQRSTMFMATEKGTLKIPNYNIKPWGLRRRFNPRHFVIQIWLENN